MICVWFIITMICVRFIGRYYSLDAVVARELVGRGQKMTAKLRKDLDIISDKTGIPMKSCLRQYDNIKRIYKVTICFCYCSLLLSCSVIPDRLPQYRYFQ